MKNLFLLLLTGFALLLASACVTPKKIDKYYSKHPEELQLQSEVFYMKNPDLLAKTYSGRFPVKERVIQGEPQIVYDTVPGPEIPCPPEGKVKCPDSYKKSEKARDTVFQEDTGKLVALKAEHADTLRALQAKHNAEHDLRIKAELLRDDYKAKYGLAIKVIIAETIVLLLAGFGFIYFKIK